MSNRVICGTYYLAGNEATWISLLGDLFEQGLYKLPFLFTRVLIFVSGHSTMKVRDYLNCGSDAFHHF